MTSNEASRQPRDKTARSDFGRKTAKKKWDPPPRVTSTTLQPSLQLLASVASILILPTDVDSTASNNQPEIRCKHEQANCREAQQKNEILVVRGSGCGCGYRSTRGGLRRFGPGLVRRGVVAGRADGVVSRPRLDSLPSRFALGLSA